MAQTQPAFVGRKSREELVAELLLPSGDASSIVWASRACQRAGSSRRAECGEALPEEISQESVGVVIHWPAWKTVQVGLVTFFPKEARRVP